MKTKHRIVSALAILTLLFLCSCEYEVMMESDVTEDGRIERVIILSGVDSSGASNNMFGIGEHTGWAVERKSAKANPDAPASEEKKLVIFRKSFRSVEEANNELSSGRDTLFHVTSVFEKKFRWFYTYIRYSDTYRAINRLKGQDVAHYFTEEDYSFIRRLPAEGKKIPKADSLYLDRLNEKMFDLFAMRAMYEEQFSVLVNVLEERSIPEAWIDSVKKVKWTFYESLVQGRKDAADELVPGILDLVGLVGQKDEITREYKARLRPVEARLDFMANAINGRYKHQIRLPGTVLQSNADSVSGNAFVWMPPPIRFALTDYEMFAETRQFNLLPSVFTLLFVLGTLYWLYSTRRV